MDIDPSEVKNRSHLGLEVGISRLGRERKYLVEGLKYYQRTDPGLSVWAGTALRGGITLKRRILSGWVE